VNLQGYPASQNDFGAETVPCNVDEYFANFVNKDAGEGLYAQADWTIGGAGYCKTISAAEVAHAHAAYEAYLRTGETGELGWAAGSLGLSRASKRTYLPAKVQAQAQWEAAYWDSVTSPV
jgi:hypothetical protein